MESFASTGRWRAVLSGRPDTKSNMERYKLHRHWRCRTQARVGRRMDERRRLTVRGGGRDAAGGGRPRRLARGGGPLEVESVSGGRKHLAESFPGTGTVPGRAGWTARRRSCKVNFYPQRGGMRGKSSGAALPLPVRLRKKSGARNGTTTTDHPRDLSAQSSRRATDMLGGCVCVCTDPAPC